MDFAFPFYDSRLCMKGCKKLILIYELGKFHYGTPRPCAALLMCLKNFSAVGNSAIGNSHLQMEQNPTAVANHSGHNFASIVEKTIFLLVNSIQSQIFICTFERMLWIFSRQCSKFTLATMPYSISSLDSVSRLCRGT